MVAGTTVKDLVERYPRLYHMAELGSWPSIQRHGLLSTSALLDLFEIQESERVSIETSHRPESIGISHPIHGEAIVRDQKPMDDTGLLRSLDDGLTPRQWYALLNKMVFFWLTRERLERLLNAKAYRGKRHVVLTVDTSTLLARHADRVLLSPINSGCTKPYPARRGKDTFLPISSYPFSHWHTKRRGVDPIVEFAVKHSVPDVRDMVLLVEECGGSMPAKIIWKP